MKQSINTQGKALISNRKIKIFFFFLLLTTIIWFLMELSKTYATNVVFKVNYENLPANKLLQSQPVSKIDVKLKASGFVLFTYKLKPQKISFNVAKLSKNKKAYYFLPNQQISNIESQLTADTEIIRVQPDTIFIDLGNLISKKIPVIPNVDFKFKLGYNLTDKLKVLPDSVIISGPQKAIDSIKEINTVFFKLNDIYESIDVDLALKLPNKNLNVTVSKKNIKLKGEVDKFTEGNFVIPVTIINVPENVTINPFPREIEVTYQAGIANFNTITTNSFLVVYDYKQYENDTLVRFLTPVIKHKSEFISSLKIKPEQIEFLIQK